MRAQRTTRLMRDALLLFCSVLILATAFAVGQKVQAAFAAPERATVTRAYHVMSVRGQVKAKRQAHRVIRRQRAELRKLRRQVQVRFVRDVPYAIRLASDLFGVSEREMWSVARCETGGTFSPFAKNRSSSASGLFQFIGWPRAGLRESFSVWDPVANALAAAWTVRHDGSWRQWACSP